METNDTKYKKQWEETLNKIKEQIGSQTYYTWFSQIKYLDFKDNEICLSVPTTFIKDWLEKNYSQLIKDTVVQQFGLESDILIKFKTMSTFENKLNSGKRENKKDISHIEYEKTGLIPEYTFDNFEVGDSNRFANAASMAVAQSPGKSYNPLFIYGEDSSMKLHLTHAIGNYIFEKNPNYNIYFISAEKFTNELINAIRNDSNEAFREKYRNFNVLLIDDIQFLAGKERTQEEFFHIFNILYNAGKQIVITSDRLPKEIPNFQGRLISRFEWGLLADIPPPDLETRMAKLKKKAGELQLNISDEIMEYIARISTDIRQIEEILNKLKVHLDLTGQTEIDVLMLQQIQNSSTSKTKRVNAPVRLIQRKTAEFFNIEPNMLFSEDLEMAPHIALYLMSKLTGYSFQKIGEMIEGNNPSTVLFSFHKIKKQLEKDKILKLNIGRLLSNIKNSLA